MGLERIGTAGKDIRTLFGVGMAAGLTDGQLLERFAARGGEASELAFEALVERHGPMVLRACRGIVRDDHEAQDAFQASFLILARKARTLWVRDTLGPWLHRVACRVASRARLAEGRRRAIERNAVAGSRGLVGGQAPDDRGRVVHEEIDRLPDRYRVPIVLCDLENRTYEEAARHLGCPIGTVKSRLARGRERLRDRLTRRGLAPAAGLLGVGVLAGSASAEVPAALAINTARVASRFAMGGPASSSVATLARGGLGATIKWRAIAGAGVVLGTVGIGSGWIISMAGPPPAIAIGQAAKPVAEAPRSDTERFEGTWVRVSTDGAKSGKIVTMVVKKAKDGPVIEALAGGSTFVVEWTTEGEKGWTTNRALMDPSKDPKRLDFFPEQQGAPKVCPGIYKLEGEVLTICFRATEGDRPSGFMPGKRGETVDVYKRAKP